MKMAEFLALSHDEKASFIENSDDTTEDLGICSQCGEMVCDPDDYCFGCQKLICIECIEKEPHLSQCFAKSMFPRSR